MYEIIKNWNNISQSLREEKQFSEFRKKLLIMQNKSFMCDKENCYSCQLNNTMLQHAK